MTYAIIAGLIFFGAVFWTVVDQIRGEDDCPHSKPENWGK